MTDLFQEEDPTIDPNKNYLTELVGDDKKFKTPQDLARGKYEADLYIEVMKKRMDEMREDYLKLREEHMAQAKLEELVTQLKQSEGERTPVKEDTKPAISPDEVDKIVAAKLTEYERTKKQQDNFKLITDKLKQNFGANYTQILKQKTEELGLTTEEVNTLARTQPNLLIKSLGLDQEQRQELFQTPIRSQQRQDSFSPSTPKQRTWSYYQELKKANPMLYFDPKIAVQMQKDAIELGDAFRDGNYYVKGLHEPNQ